MSCISEQPVSIVEADHLTRIHLKLGLEDIGFVVREEDARLTLDVPEDMPLNETGDGPIP